jgi:hypothetical protein
MDLEYKTGYRNSGRKPGLIDYCQVSYNDRKYIKCTIQHNYEDVQFIIDADDFDKVKERAWHLSSGKYIGSTFYLDGGIKLELYLHNLIMNKITFDGKGTKESVDHINRNGLDNRKENLRIISQSEQNMNQSKKKRNITLPLDSGIKPEDIPKHIWYIKANGFHGDRFAVEFKTENICIKTTSSKKISLISKLEDAKKILNELYLVYPTLNPTYYETQINELNKSFSDILRITPSA